MLEGLDMGKLSRSKKADSSASDGKSGHQSSLHSFFKKKSEIPSRLFAQVRPVTSKELKQKATNLSLRGKVGNTSAPVKEKKTGSLKRSSGDTSDEVPSKSDGHHDNSITVIPDTPEPASTKVKQSLAVTSASADTPFSKIIPDTPTARTGKKQQFTSLLDAMSGSVTVKDAGSIGNNSLKQSPKFSSSAKDISKKTKRSALSALNCDVENFEKESQEPAPSPGLSDMAIVSHRKAEHENKKRSFKDSGKRNMTKLSRKYNKQTKEKKSDSDEQDENVEGGVEDDDATNGTTAGGIGVKDEMCRHGDHDSIELKPSVFRVRNPFSKKQTKTNPSLQTKTSLSLSRSTSSKRSPVRGNSPFAKRLQASKESLEMCNKSDVHTTVRIERVKKSLLEQYGKSDSLVNEGFNYKDNEHRSELSSMSEDSAILPESVTSDCDITSSDNNGTAMKIDDEDSPLNSVNGLVECGTSCNNSIGPVLKHKSNKDVNVTSTTQTHVIKSVEPIQHSNHNGDVSADQVEQELSDDHKGNIMDEVDDEFTTVVPDSCPMSVARTPGSECSQNAPSFVSDSSPIGPTPVKINNSNKNEDSRTIVDPSRAALDFHLQSVSANAGADKSASIVTNHVKGNNNLESDKFVDRDKDVVVSTDIEDDASADSLRRETTASLTPARETSKLSADLNNPLPHPSEKGVGESPSTGALWDGMNDSLLEGLDLDDLECDQQPQVHEQTSPVTSLNKKFAVMSPFKPGQKGSGSLKISSRPADLNRYTVTKLEEMNYEKILHVVSMTDQSEKTCILKGTWYQTPVQEGMVVAIHGSFNKESVCEISQQHGFIVINPDHLLTGTAVSNSIRCMRRSVLSEKFKGLERGNRAMLLGSLLHEVFDQAIMKNHFQKNQLMQIAKDVLLRPQFLCDMYSLKVDEANLLEEVEEYAESIKRWSDTYLGPSPKDKGKLDIKWPGQTKYERCGVSVCGVTDIEETVWSPRWGIKGKVDLTVQVEIHKSSSRGSPTQHTVPLELKTGRETNSIEHRSQLILYSIMLGDLNPMSSGLGFLLYLKTAAMKGVPANQLDKRELIHLRNQLAFHLSQTVRSLPSSTCPAKPSLAPPLLPEPIQDDFTCSRCAHVISCGMLQRLDGTMNQLSKPMQDLFAEQLNHLSDSHLQYFAHWFLLCSLEHEETQKRNNSKNIWCKQSTDREKDGECWSGMWLSSCTPKDQQNGGFVLTFCRKPDQASLSSLDSSFMDVGTRVVVSEEGTRKVARCVGLVDIVTAHAVKIISESQLKVSSTSQVVYRIDKDDSYNTMAASLVNLAKVLMPEHSRVRNLVVDKELSTSVHKPNLPSRARPEVSKIFATLNEDQRVAIKAVLRSQDYTLIIGMPGTGKTTTIVALVRILVACDMSVLLTSYTHSAVDNILLKLEKHGVDFLRLGAQHSIHPDLKRYSEMRFMKKATSVQHLAQQMEAKKVVATTSLGMRHALFSRHRFDVCIVDEASQISQPVCLGPLFSAQKFVLVGDQCQLPPLVQSSRAKDLGMDESLFQRLVEAHPSSVVRLSIQFRMNAEIMSLSNALVYDGAMRCASDAVATATLCLPAWEEWMKTSRSESWLVDALRPQTVLQFLNTDPMPTPTEEGKTRGNTSMQEANLVKIIVRSLIQCGCGPGDIGIISPYRRQCQLLETTLAHMGSKGERLEVNTVDKYQGRDKRVIIMSFSHSKMESQGGSILEDLRRLNVALTRAKHKLLLIGSRRALGQFQPLKELLTYLEDRQLIKDLPSSTSAHSTSI